MNTEKIKEKQNELNYQKWQTVYSASYSLAFTLPLTAILYISVNEPKASNILPLILCFCMFGATIPNVYKSAKKCTQLKKEIKDLQKQY
jgi:hypothetical protein